MPKLVNIQRCMDSQWPVAGGRPADICLLNDRTSSRATMGEQTMLMFACINMNRNIQVLRSLISDSVRIVTYFDGRLIVGWGGGTNWEFASQTRGRIKSLERFDFEWWSFIRTIQLRAYTTLAAIGFLNLSYIFPTLYNLHRCYYCTIRPEHI